MFIDIAFLLGSDMQSSLLTHDSLLTFLWLSYFIPMCECLGKYSCMNSSFPIAMLNGT